MRLRGTEAPLQRVMGIESEYATPQRIGHFLTLID
jgi:hypothetical protein